MTTATSNTSGSGSSSGESDKCKPYSSNNTRGEKRKREREEEASEDDEDLAPWGDDIEDDEQNCRQPPTQHTPTRKDFCDEAVAHPTTPESANTYGSLFNITYTGYRVPPRDFRNTTPPEPSKSRTKLWERKPVDESWEEYYNRKEGGGVKRAKLEEEKSEMEVGEREGPLIDTHRSHVLGQGEV